MGRKSIEIYLGADHAIRSDALERVAKRAGHFTISAWLQAIADEEIERATAAVVGYIQLTRRVATAEHTCSECGNEIGNLDLYLAVYADGGTGKVVCSDCATN